MSRSRHIECICRKKKYRETLPKAKECDTKAWKARIYEKDQNYNYSTLDSRNFLKPVGCSSERGVSWKDDTTFQDSARQYLVGRGDPSLPEGRCGRGVRKRIGGVSAWGGRKTLAPPWDLEIVICGREEVEIIVKRSRAYYFLRTRAKDWHIRRPGRGTHRPC